MEIHRKVWGMEKWIVNSEKYCGKILCLDKGCKCSYHYHKIKDETFHILQGIVLMKIGNKEQEMIPGDTVHVSPGTKHCFTGITYAEILEISTQHFEDDSYRLTENQKGNSSFEKRNKITKTPIIICPQCKRQMNYYVLSSTKFLHDCPFCDIQIPLEIIGDKVIFKNIKG